MQLLGEVEAPLPPAKRVGAAPAGIASRSSYDMFVVCVERARIVVVHKSFQLR